MVARRWLIAVVVAASLSCLVLLSYRTQVALAPALLLPEFAASRDQVTRLALIGAGRTALVTMERNKGQWQVAERGGWPADDSRVQQLLDELAGATIIERKTARADRYARIDVEDLSDPEAGGLGLVWKAGQETGELIIGAPGPAVLQGRHVRRPGQAQALLVDRSLFLDRAALAWLDHRIIDLPMPRIRAVQVRPRDGTAFDVVAVDDGFAVAGVSTTHSSREACSALAGFLDQLVFEDIATAASNANLEPLPDMSSEFLAVDGQVISVRAWRRDARYWVALSLRLDEDMAQRWLAGSAGTNKAEDLRALRIKTRILHSRLQDYRFLLAIEKTAVLVKTRPQYLASSP